MAGGLSAVRSGQVAAAAGVNRQTLRYYERRGLLTAPERSLGGHRVYPPEAVTVLRVIKAAQRLGFTLDEVADLLGPAPARLCRPSAIAGGGGGGPAGPGRQGRTTRASGASTTITAKLAEVQARIADLELVAGTLRAAVEAGCDDLVTCAAVPECPIPFG